MKHTRWDKEHHERIDGSSAIVVTTKFGEFIAECGAEGDQEAEEAADSIVQDHNAAPLMLEALRAAHVFLLSIKSDTLLRREIQDYVNATEFWEAFDEANNYTNEAIQQVAGGTQ